MSKIKGPVVAALDIGTTGIRALQAMGVGDLPTAVRLKILGQGCVPSRGVREAKVENLGELVEAIHGAVESCSDRSRIKFKRVTLGIAGNYTQSRNISGEIPIKYSRAICERDIDRVVRETFENNFPLSAAYVPINYFIRGYRLDDDYVSDPLGMRGSSLGVDIHVVYVHYDKLENLKRAVQKAGLIVERVVIQSFASSLAVLDEEQRQASTIVLDIGGGTTDIAVFYKGQPVFTGAYPYAGEIITSDIAKVFNIGLKEAEKLKCECDLTHLGSPFTTLPIGKNIYSKKEAEAEQPDIVGVIEARIEEIFTDIRSMLEKEDVFSRYAPSGLVITGGGASLKGIVKKAQAIFERSHGIGHFDVVVGRPTHRVVTSGLQVHDDPSLSTVIGLALCRLTGEPFSGGIPRRNSWLHNVVSFWKRMWASDRF